MGRRWFILCLAGGLLASAGFASAQSAKIPRIGYLSPQTYSANAAVRAAFEKGLRDGGYIAGQSAFLEARYADGEVERLPKLAEGLVALQVDVIFATAAAAAVAAKKTTNAIPIVFMSVYDPVRAGLATSLAHPGGNATGVTNSHVELAQKRVQLLAELVPGSKQIGALTASLNREETAAILQEMNNAATALHIQLHVEEVGNAEAFDEAFIRMRKAGVRVIMPVPHPLFYTNRVRLIRSALKAQLFMMGWTREFAEDGAPLSFGASNEDMAYLAAGYVSRIVKGDKPANLPIQKPARLELIVNRGAAKALRVAVPQDLVLRADRVID